MDSGEIDGFWREQMIQVRTDDSGENRWIKVR